jgi:hypothetical protein
MHSEFSELQTLAALKQLAFMCIIIIIIIITTTTTTTTTTLCKY